MYDYVKAIASKEKIAITFAYSGSENGVRKTEYIYEKLFNRNVSHNMIFSMRMAQPLQSFQTTLMRSADKNIIRR